MSKRPGRRRELPPRGTATLPRAAEAGAPTAPATRPPRRRSERGLFVEFLAVSFAALVLTFAAFSPGLRGAFVSDDINTIVENEWVNGPLDPVGIATTFSWWGQGRSDAPGYRPAATLSFALSREISGLDPYSFRLVNFALNALCAGLLFALARVLGLSRITAAAAALVFAVLPLHSEPVVWVVGRAELGAAAGFLLAALCCALVRSGASLALLAVAAAALAVGLAFKENAITVLAAPAIFLVLLRGDAETRRRDLLAIGALAAGALVYAFVRSFAAGPAIEMSAESLLDNPLSVVGFGTRLLGAVAVLGRYLALTFWPSSLSVDYSYDALGIGPGFVANPDSVVALLFVAAALWAVLRGPGRRELVAVGLLLAAAAYSIVSNTVFVLGTILGERLFYLPTAGLLLAIAAMAAPFFDRRGRAQQIAVATTAVVVLASLVVDRARAAEWMTPVSLFGSAVAEAPRSARAHMEYASALGAAGRSDEAALHFAKALEILPDYAAAAYNQGNMYARLNRYDEAAASYRRALEKLPTLTRGWHNLALTERLRGNRDAWIEALKSAVATAPQSVTLPNELGEALLAVGRHEEAIAVYDSLAAEGRAQAASWFNRGVANHHLGGCAAAVEDYRKAAAAPGAPPQAFVAAAGCLRELGRSEEAAAIEQSGKVANRDTRR